MPVKCKFKRIGLMILFVVSLTCILTGCMRLDGNSSLPNFNKQTNYVK